MYKIKNINELILICLLLSGLFLRLIWINAPIERDEAHFGYISWMVLENRSQLYLNLLDTKLPLIHLIYSLPVMIFGNSIIPVRILNNILFGISIIFLFQLTKLLFNRNVALISTIFYIYGMNLPFMEGFLALTESFAVPLVVISFYFFLLYWKRLSGPRSRILLFISIFALFLGVLLKVYSIAYLIIFLIWGNAYSKKCSKPFVRDFFFSVLYVVIIVGISWAFLRRTIFLHGPSLLDIIWFFVRVSGTYFGYCPPFSSIASNPPQFWKVIIPEIAPIICFSLLGLMYSITAKKRHNIYFVTLWFFLSLLSSIIKPSFGHYYLLLIPPASILAGIGLNKLGKKKHLRRRMEVTLLVIILFSVSGFFCILQYPDMHLEWPIEWRYNDEDSYRTQLTIAEYINNFIPQDSTILILGNSYTIPFLCERESVTIPPLQCFYMETRQLIFPIIHTNNTLIDLEKYELFHYVLTSSNFPIPTFVYEFLVENTPDMISLNYTRHNYEYHLLRKDIDTVGAVIKFPHDDLKCPGFDEPLFKELTENISNIRIGNANIYILKIRNE